jgi:hypothetical protein
LSLSQHIVLYSSIIILAVFYYLRVINKKSNELDSFEDGVCPKCKSANVENVKLKSGGCGGVSEYKFECFTCGYKDSYNLAVGGCDTNNDVDKNSIIL